MARPKADAVDYYHRSAAAFAPAYESVTFDDVHGALLRHLPAPPASILDIGAGTGRDARALGRLGHIVVAVEPAAAFRALGRGADDRIEWLDDSLPRLQKVRARGRTFDFILCSAVLMSLAADALPEGFASMAALLAPGGKLAISVRNPTPDEAPLLLHRHSYAAIRAAAASASLSLLDARLLDDALGRPIAWRSFVFEHGEPALSRGARAPRPTGK
jgi:SAM-dependent methyltransferase